MITVGVPPQLILFAGLEGEVAQGKDFEVLGLAATAQGVGEGASGTLDTLAVPSKPYMVNILRSSQEYEGPAWATYDVAFRRQAATTGHREWSRINPSLYTTCLMGKAKYVSIA